MFFPAQRRPWQKIGSHRPFDGLFALSWRHWPHSLCKRGKCKHTLSPSQRRPSQKTGSHRPFDGLFALSWRHWPHSLCKRGKCKKCFFLHNAVLDRKLVPTDRSMVYLPCLDVTGHIPFASGANVNIRFFLHNAVLYRKLVPTDRSMVYFPCLDVTGHIPFASGANVNIRFFLHNAVLDRKLVPTDCSMVYLSIYLPFSLYLSLPLSTGPHNSGVGGTWALAHSIYICMDISIYPSRIFLDKLNSNYIGDTPRMSIVGSIASDLAPDPWVSLNMAGWKIHTM